MSVSRYSDTLNASALVEPDYWKNQCREKQHEIADLKVEVEDLTRTLVTERQEHEERRSALDDARNEMQQLRIDLDKTQTELQQSNADVRTLEENLRQFGSAIAKAVREHYPEA